MTHPRAAIAAATARLAAAGVSSARVDAELLIAHLLGIDRGRLVAVDDPLPTAVAARYAQLVERRASRVPLQHLTGIAPFYGLDLAVGPGVFIPRPETELLVEAALAVLPTDRPTTVVDLCAGSGAIGLAIAHHRPSAAVHSVEIDPDALGWLRTNRDRRAALGDRPITVHRADVTGPDLLTELSGRVDVVVTNPPYVPSGAVLEPEVRDHDPHRALFADVDGLAVIATMVEPIRRLLVPGGRALIEHDDSHAAGVEALFDARSGFERTEGRTDLAGRDRFVVTRRASTVEPA
ncbi:peptide chain release factor N(5)-glutamine methyltransferase [Millisia brevis]|uniref:peptide chain release factor N(5)-glutamine methyltransferase n=1 Tax=Millisia brevis TaxID=264148 RepID=UPI0008362B69|nr:peptide chain release factor N(5)-glutamine methyltransferase [Millisia brevis]